VGLVNLTIGGRTATMTLNRPEAGNVLARHGDGIEIRSACEEINQNREVRCAVLTGAGKLVADISEIE